MSNVIDIDLCKRNVLEILNNAKDRHCFFRELEKELKKLRNRQEKRILFEKILESIQIKENINMAAMPIRKQKYVYEAIYTFLCLFANIYRDPNVNYSPLKGKASS